LIILSKVEMEQGRVEVGAAYVVNNDNLPRPQQLLGDHDAAQGVRHPATGVAYDVGVAFFEAEGACGV
jgi:hypothetical protein